MKYLPRKYRESQSDWFGKRGMVTAVLNFGDAIRYFQIIDPTFKKISINTSCCTVRNISPPHSRCQNNGLSDWFSRLIKNPPIRAKGTVADLNVYLMKVRFDWTKLTRSYLRMFLYAFRFLTRNLKIKVQKRHSKRT